MKKFTVIALATMFLGACKKDFNHPIKVAFQSSVNTTSPALNCTLPGVPFAIANSGYFLSGTATHIGNINPTKSKGQDGFCNLSAAFILSTKTSGQIVAANGDYISYSGDDLIDLNKVISQEATTAAITGLWTITGGTGRFVGASGSITIKGIVDVAAEGGPTFNIKGEGTIAY